MGKGSGATQDVNGTVVIDDGTLARTDTPIPGPIGLDAHSGGSSHVSASVTVNVAGYARQQDGKKIGDGQCFAFADTALTTSGARSASDYGTITDNADYVWGTSISRTDLQAGDIIQFRSYRYDREIKTEHADGSWHTDTDRQERPHHTAIVDSVLADGEVVVLEQNAPVGSTVHRTHLFLADSTTKSGDTTTTVQVKGKLWFYRPQAK